MSIIIGVSGCSGSGKTTFVQYISSKHECLVLDWDDFDKVSRSPKSYLEWFERGHDASEFDYSLLADLLKQLKHNQAIQHPITKKTFEPTPYILVCLPLGKTHIQTAQYVDLFIHLDVPLDISLARRTYRDLVDMDIDKNTVANDLKLYLEGFRPLFTMKEVKELSDLVLDGSKSLADLYQDFLNFKKSLPF